MEVVEEIYQETGFISRALMHILTRQLRFCVSPFGDDSVSGSNTYSSMPAGADGLNIYIELTVSLTSEVDPDTGFIMNVAQVDDIFRKHFVRELSRRIELEFELRRNFSMPALGVTVRELIKKSNPVISGVFITEAELCLSPFKKIIVEMF